MALEATRVALCLGVTEVRPRPKFWTPDGGSCGGLDEFWQSDQIVGRLQQQDGCASELEGAGVLKRVIPRT
jgi:hypothetical protein